MIAQMQGGAETRWDDVRLFLALYRHRTLGGAARTVGLDASTMSRRLVALEEAVGAHLFDRTREGLVPSNSAESLLAAAEEMAEAHGRFSHGASGLERAAEGLVRLSVPPGLAESFVVPALVRLRQKHPLIRLELDASVHFVDLTRREADLAVRTRRPQAGDLVSLKLGERQWLPMQTAKRASKQHKPIASWATLPWIGWGDDMAGFAPAKWLTEHVPRDAVILRTSHFTTQVAAVEAGLGVALLPPAYARLPALVPVRSAPGLGQSVTALPRNETWLVGHRALRAVPRVAAVWAFLVEEFARFEPAAPAGGR